MAKLTNLRPKLTSMGSRLTVASPSTEQGREKHRAATQPWRAWYKTVRWERLRKAAFIRDRYTCRRSGVLLIGKHPAPDSPVANHKQPHRGDPDLFWSLDNIETVSKAVHDSEIQSQEASMPKGVWY